MESENKNIISSFKVQDKLNPEIWSKDGENYTMKPEIRDSLLGVVEDYIKFTDIEVDVEDVTLTGSLSNFNWSRFSDVDLHILVDLKGLPDSLLRKYLDSRRIIWNSIRAVTVKGFDVEVYIQDVSEPHFASGVYSVMYSEWVVEPKEESIIIDPQKILDKSKDWMGKIDGVIVDSERYEPEDVLDRIDELRAKIKKYRGIGLESKGEYSYENLTFKFLRRNGYLKKLIDVRNELIDKTLTVEGKVSNS
jgi:hypothetical protein